MSLNSDYKWFLAFMALGGFNLGFFVQGWVVGKVDILDWWSLAGGAASFIIATLRYEAGVRRDRTPSARP